MSKLPYNRHRLALDVGELLLKGDDLLLELLHDAVRNGELTGEQRARVLQLRDLVVDWLVVLDYGVKRRGRPDLKLQDSGAQDEQDTLRASVTEVRSMKALTLNHRVKRIS